MNKMDLQKLLHESSVSTELYNLDGMGRVDERYCLSKKGEKWQVYFLERGIKTTDELFETEEACQYIYQQLVD